jgi:hypothetical protein
MRGLFSHYFNSSKAGADRIFGDVVAAGPTIAQGRCDDRRQTKAIPDAPSPLAGGLGAEQG